MSARFLEGMVEEVERELERGFYDRIAPGEAPTPLPSLRRRLLWQPRPRWVLELKHASPGHHRSALPSVTPSRFLEMAQDPHTVGLSVIPQPYSFGGSLEEFAAVSRSTSLPVIFKDFVVDPRQVGCARRLGAAAVLLLARLEHVGALRPSLQGLVTEVHRAGMEALVEVHEPADVPLALRCGPDILGVNARDLSTLELSRERACETLRAARDQGVPLLGMSGVAGPSDLRTYEGAGAWGALVGTSFILAPDPRAFLEGLATAPGAES
jgi:indole-3-glycerol phosphate synthase